MIESLAIMCIPGVAAAVLWSPVLFLARFRRLFKCIPPTDSLISNYLLVAVGLSIPFVVGTLIVLATNSTEGAALSNTLLNLVFGLAFAYVVLIPMVTGIALPRVGLDWDPTSYGFGTWILLLGAALWYTGIFVVPLVIFAFVLALPT